MTQCFEGPVREKGPQMSSVKVRCNREIVASHEFDVLVDAAQLLQPCFGLESPPDRKSMSRHVFENVVS